MFFINTITQGVNDKVVNSLDKVETDNSYKNARLPSEGKTLTQPSILTILTKAVKRKKSQPNFGMAKRKDKLYWGKK